MPSVDGPLPASSRIHRHVESKQQLCDYECGFKKDQASVIISIFLSQFERSDGALLSGNTRPRTMSERMERFPVIAGEVWITKPAFWLELAWFVPEELAVGCRPVVDTNRSATRDILIADQ